MSRLSRHPNHHIHNRDDATKQSDEDDDGKVHRFSMRPSTGGGGTRANARSAVVEQDHGKSELPSVLTASTVDHLHHRHRTSSNGEDGEQPGGGPASLLFRRSPTTTPTRSFGGDGCSSESFSSSASLSPGSSPARNRRRRYGSSRRGLVQRWVTNWLFTGNSRMAFRGGGGNSNSCCRCAAGEQNSPGTSGRRRRLSLSNIAGRFAVAAVGFLVLASLLATWIVFPAMIVEDEDADFGRRNGVAGRIQQGHHRHRASSHNHNPFPLLNRNRRKMNIRKGVDLASDELLLEKQKHVRVVFSVDGWDSNSRHRGSQVTKRNLSLPPPIEEGAVADGRRRGRRPDFGGLFIDMFEEEDQKRAIYHDPRLDAPRREPDSKDKKEEESEFDWYYAFDDDAVRDMTNHEEEATKEGAGSSSGRRPRSTCRRTSWHRWNPVNCNSVHELGFETRVRDGRVSYLDSGAYRDVYAVNLVGESGGVDQRVVWKDFGVDANFDTADFEFNRMDSVVAERLSSSSRDLIVDIYGFCALSHIGEHMPNGNLEVAAKTGRKKKVVLNDEEHLDPQNDFTPSQKLQYSLEMAEAVLLLHSWPDGIMVHDDIQLSQFLFKPDGHLKLNDFNRAEIMLWNEADKKYCRYQNNPGHGDWRAPEEYFDYPLNEKIDVWSLCNNMYAILTGLYPFYLALDGKVVRQMVKDGKKPYIDPRWRNRSFAESKIVELLPKCYEYDPDRRIDIFDMVAFLRDAVEQNSNHQQHLHE